MLMLPLSLLHDIVYIPGMWIKVAVTSGTALPTGRLRRTVADTAQRCID